MTSPPPTLAELLSEHRVTHARVSCMVCARTVDVPMENFGAPPETPFPALKAMWRRPCGRCGSRDVDVRPAWPAARGQGEKMR